MLNPPCRTRNRSSCRLTRSLSDFRSDLLLSPCSSGGFPTPLPWLSAPGCPSLLVPPCGYKLKPPNFCLWSLALSRLYSQLRLRSPSPDQQLKSPPEPRALLPAASQMASPSVLSHLIPNTSQSSSSTPCQDKPLPWPCQLCEGHCCSPITSHSGSWWGRGSRAEGRLSLGFNSFQP